MSIVASGEWNITEVLLTFHVCLDLYSGTIIVIDLIKLAVLFISLKKHFNIEK